MKKVSISTFFIIVVMIFSIPIMASYAETIPQDDIIKCDSINVKGVTIPTIIISKITTDEIVCVTNSTAEKLIERGWGYVGNVIVKLSTDKIIYEIYEPVEITVKNIGTSSLFEHPERLSDGSHSRHGIYISHESGPSKNLVSYCSVYNPCKGLMPNEEIALIWNSKNIPNSPGQYTLQAKYYDIADSEYLYEIKFELIDTKGILESYSAVNLSGDIERMKESHKVFSGTVIEKRSIIPALNVFEYDLKVENNLKNTPEELIHFRSHDAFAMCGPLEENSEYIIFLKDKEICEYSIQLPNDALSEMIEFSSPIFWWQ